MISGASARLLPWLLALAAGCGALPAAAAEWDLKRLMQDLSQVKAAKGRFVERKYLSILTAPLESSGTLSYVAPDRLEKHTLAPRAESLVLEGSRLTLEGGEPKRRRTLRLDEYPAVGVFVESIRSTLAGDLSLLGQLFDLSLQGDERKWLVLGVTPAGINTLHTMPPQGDVPSVPQHALSFAQLLARTKATSSGKEPDREP